MTPSKRGPVESGKYHACGAGGMVALSLLGYFAGLRPLLQQHDHSTNQRRMLVAETARAEDLQKQERALDRSLVRTRQALADSPLTLQIASFRNERLALLTDLAAAHGLTVDGIQSGDVERDEHFDRVPIVLSGKGSFPNCGRFLHRLNRTFPDMGVKSFHVNGQPGRKPRDVTFSYDMIWYAAPTSVTLADEG